jgi:hypothetical protein
MGRARRASIPAVGAVWLLLSASAGASLLSDFQARLAQTVWAAQQTEVILRTLPPSATPASTPDGLASYAALLAENTAALNAAATARGSTDEQRRVMADGLQAVSTALQDQMALAGNRGLLGLVSTLSSLREGCRSTIAQLSAVRR